MQMTVFEAACLRAYEFITPGFTSDDPFQANMSFKSLLTLLNAGFIPFDPTYISLSDWDDTCFREAQRSVDFALTYEESKP